MSRLSKKAKAERAFFGMRKRADGQTTNCIANAETNVSRLSEQRLSVVQNITPILMFSPV